MKLPPHNGTKTSRAAARAIIPHTSKQRHAVYVALIRRLNIGATREELYRLTRMSPDSVRPRCRELLAAGLVYEKGTRRTRAGRMAAILHAK